MYGPDDRIPNRLHRQIGGLLSFKDAIDVAGRAPILVNHVGPIGDQAAGGGEMTVGIERGQLVLGRKRDD
jgi:hypothetical protein